MIGPGAINYSAFYRFTDLPGSETIRGAMLAGLAPVMEALGSLGVSARDAGLSDLAALGADGALRKIAGNSQARKRRSVVVHGTLLADPDFELMQSALSFPSSTPEYRAGRDHRAFLTSLKELGAPSDLDSFANALLAALPPHKVVVQEPRAEELAQARQLRDEKYGNDAWNFRR